MFALAESGDDGSVDLLVCGGCERAFALSDILVFIKHKASGCGQGNSRALFDDTGRGDGAWLPDSRW